MSQEIRVFSNQEFGNVRVIEKDGEPWILGKDVAEILQYTNTAKAIRDHVDEEDKLTERIVLSGQNREAIFINESGLYSLILSSKLPTAKSFKRWITAEVIPSIRKHGAYLTDNVLEKTLLDPDYLIKLANVIKDEREKNKILVEKNAVLTEENEVLKPKATYYDLVLSCKNAVNITAIAKDYGKSGVWLNKFLHECHVQYNINGQWLLYAEYADCGYTKSTTTTFENGAGETSCRMHTKWTQRGRLFIYDLLKSHGILPLMEQECDYE